ncbi:MAG: hypothetical protein U0575_08520 [Phycisphaerales bacterium]
MPRPRGRPPGSTASSRRLRDISISDLHAELRRRHSQAKPLEARRAKLAATLAKLDAELASLGHHVGGTAVAAVRRGPGRPRGSRGPRPANTLSLVDTLQKVLTDKTLGVNEAAAAVLSAGYRTQSKNFRTVVNQTLLVNKGKFRKVDRGRYTAK